MRTTKTWHGSKSLERLLVEIDALRPHPDNPRRGSVERIVESLRRFGQYRPLVVNADNTLLAGHHTWYAAKELGWTHIAVVPLDLPEAEARALLVADNRLGDVARYEEEQLAEVLQRLQNEGLLEGTGWTPDEVDDLLVDLEAIPTAPLVEFEGGYAESEEEFASRIAASETARAETVGVEPLREVVLMFRVDEHAAFGRRVEFLKRTYGQSGSVGTVYEAVRRQAEAEGYEENEPPGAES